MTLTLQLTTDEEARLAQKAQRAGVEPQELLRRFIAAGEDKPYDPAADPFYSDEWTEYDRRSATAASVQRLDSRFGEESGYDA